MDFFDFAGPDRISGEIPERGELGGVGIILLLPLTTGGVATVILEEPLVVSSPLLMAAADCPSSPSMSSALSCDILSNGTERADVGVCGWRRCALARLSNPWIRLLRPHDGPADAGRAPAFRMADGATLAVDAVDGLPVRRRRGWLKRGFVAMKSAIALACALDCCAVSPRLSMRAEGTRAAFGPRARVLRRDIVSFPQTCSLRSI
eukprot:SAG31_NODE_311_length_17866_cov_7.010750_9_plen_206_part_00